MNQDSVEDCLEFFKKGFPQSTSKNFRTQLGVHFEEIHEMLLTLDAEKEEDRILFYFLAQAVKGAADHLKEQDGKITIKNRVEFLDGLCDQLVTAIGVAYHSQMDIVGAFKEVNRSNHSKFGENGEPILDKNMKLIKGPYYSKPDLNGFV